MVLVALNTQKKSETENPSKRYLNTLGRHKKTGQNVRLKEQIHPPDEQAVSIYEFQQPHSSSGLTKCYVLPEYKI